MSDNQCLTYHLNDLMIDESSELKIFRTRLNSRYFHGPNTFQLTVFTFLANHLERSLAGIDH